MSAHPARPRRYYPHAIELGNIRDVESFCRRNLDRLPNGMYLRPDEYEDELAEMVTQLVDWYRPVATPWCGSWSRTDSPTGASLAGSGCGRRRGQQHAWNCDALPPQRIRRSECLGCGRRRSLEGPTIETRGCDVATREEWRAEIAPATVHADDCPYWVETKKSLSPNVRLRRIRNNGRQIKGASWGCSACGNQRGERHSETCEHRHELQQRYDPGKTDDFFLFARFKLLTYYVPDLCRRILGRTGGRIAERSHSELDERADAGRRPWEAAAPEQDGLRAHLGADARRTEAGRDRARARGSALLGLRPAR